MKFAIFAHSWNLGLGEDYYIWPKINKTSFYVCALPKIRKEERERKIASCVTPVALL